MMTDVLTDAIGAREVTSANDRALARALNGALSVIDMDRRMNAYSDHRTLPIEDRIANLETALLALATVVSRRLEL